MKTISLQEPYATLIKEGYKKVETRSWKTTYRGDILIHASQGKKFLKGIDNPEVLDLIKGLELNNGSIICKATLVDCIEMTKDFINQAKSNHQEYILGIYEEGRYAWILENISPIEPIKVPGKLGLWDYNI
ncbi:MAG: ASCH domain-containing protein [Mycoplasmatota bacterium]|nr:ASCH domain-containing protein [Mycoplasmatota bacterium]